jgi:hypothetical protein
MEIETGLLYNSLLWGSPVLWLVVAATAFARGMRVSAALVAVSAAASLTQPILFFAGYSLPTDWETNPSSLMPAQRVAWVAEYVLQVVTFLALLLGYVYAIRRN